MVFVTAAAGRLPRQPGLRPGRPPGEHDQRYLICLSWKYIQMENEVVKYERIKFAVQIACIAILSSLVAAGIIGCAIMGPLGMLGGPILVIIKGYIVFPIVLIFYTAAWFVWKKTSISRLNYCLSISCSLAIVLAIIALLTKGQYWLLRIFGFPLGGFIPVFASLWLMTEYKTEKVMQFHKPNPDGNGSKQSNC